MKEHRPKKLLDQVRDAIRLTHCSCRTEQVHLGWVSRYALCHYKRHAKEVGVREVEALQTHVAPDVHVAVWTRDQALSATLFLR